jgi:hypothetical protein
MMKFQLFQSCIPGGRWKFSERIFQVKNYQNSNYGLPFAAKYLMLSYSARLTKQL